MINTKAFVEYVEQLGKNLEAKGFSAEQCKVIIGAMMDTKVEGEAVLDVKDVLQTIDIKASGGLCQMTHEGTREFLKDIRKIIETTGVEL